MGVGRRSSEPSEASWIIKGDGKVSFIKTRPLPTYAGLTYGLEQVCEYIPTWAQKQVWESRLAAVYLKLRLSQCPACLRDEHQRELSKQLMWRERENRVDRWMAATSIWDRGFFLSSFPAVTSKEPELFLRLFDVEARRLCQALDDCCQLLDSCLSCAMPKAHSEMILIPNKRNASLGSTQQCALLIGNLDSW